jgi:hypothetical protein
MGVAPELQFVCGRKVLSDLQYFYAPSFLSFYQLLCASDETKKITAFENRLAKIRCRTYATLVLNVGSPNRLAFSRGKSLNRLQRLLYHAFVNCSLTGRLRATNPKDCIFALLGIADADNLGIVPDYSIDCKTLYTNVAKGFLDRKDFSVLSYAQDPKCLIRLASWVPDWTSNMEVWIVTPFGNNFPPQQNSSL